MKNKYFTLLNQPLIVKALKTKRCFMIKTTKVDQNQQKLIDQNQRLIQHLNTEIHGPAEIRQLLSEITGEKIDVSNEIRLPFYSDYGHNLHFGKNIFINSGVMFTDLGGITLDDDALIGPGASLVSVNHPLDPSHHHGIELQSIHIKKNAWIGAKAIILPGITVGENAIVGAGAVVVGSPAKCIRTLDPK